MTLTFNYKYPNTSLTRNVNLHGANFSFQPTFLHQKNPPQWLVYTPRILSENLKASCTAKISTILHSFNTPIKRCIMQHWESTVSCYNNSYLVPQLMVLHSTEEKKISISSSFCTEKTSTKPQKGWQAYKWEAFSCYQGILFPVLHKCIQNGK